jgi:ABC-2 type transport system ATP-binding protein
MTLSIRGLSKLLGGRKVLDDVSLEVPPGQTLALFGQNGAGKSTLLRLLAGVMDADAGHATLDGETLLESGLAGRTILGAWGEARRKRSATPNKQIGYVPEAADAPPHMTPRELLALVASLKRCPLPDSSLLERLGIEGYSDQVISSLSLGQRRRTCLAAALVGEVRLLLLDEPTNGLDVSGVRMLVDVLGEHARRGGITVVATHDEPWSDQLGARRLRLVGGRINESF